MKKMITALCVLAVAVGSMMAASNYTKAEPIRTMSMVNDKDGIETSGKYANGFTESAAFDQSSNGYGWIYGYNQKISWSPANDLYVSAYRKKSAAGTGAIGGMAGNWGNNITATISEHAATMNCRYPSISGMDKYGFATYNHNAATPASAYISVYDKDEEGWTVPIVVKAPNNSSPNNAWCGTSDVTKDAAGNYVLMTSWEYDGLNAMGAKKVAIAVGKSATPYNATSWVWSDYTAMCDSAVADGSKQFFEIDRLKAVWGKNGFGIALGIAKESDAAKPAIYYVYTKDYGQTWIKTADNKFFKVTTELPFVGKSYATDAGDVLIEESFMMWNTDVIIDENNDVHLLGKAVVGSGTSVMMGIQKATDGTPVDGFYRWTGKFDAQGNPENGTDWNIGFVAHYVGWAETDNAPVGADGQPTSFEYKYSNAHTMSMSYAGNGTIVASWLDRAPTNALLAETVGTELGANWSNLNTTFMLDPYIIVSTDYGVTWQYADAAEKRAHQVTLNADQKVHEEGFGLSKRSLQTNPGANGTIETYAGYQKANYAAPGAPPVDCPGAYIQNLHVAKLLINPVGIEVQAVTEGKTVELAQNYPNPFNPTTAINFSLQNAGNVKLSVFNAQGQEVANLINSKMTSGAHTANFNAANLNSGVYFYKLSVDGQSAVKKNGSD